MGSDVAAATMAGLAGLALGYLLGRLSRRHGRLHVVVDAGRDDDDSCRS